jgi:hypothetical protein
MHGPPRFKHLRAPVALLVLATTTALNCANTTAPRLIEIVADGENSFHVVGEKSPIIRAKAGELLRLRITAHKGQEMARDGAVHALVVKKLRDDGWDFRLYEGSQEFTVTAPLQAGEYIGECTVKCGRGHDDMRLKLIVTPQ